MKNNKDNNILLVLLLFFSDHIVPIIKTISDEIFGVRRNRFSDYEKKGKAAFEEIWNSDDNKKRSGTGTAGQRVNADRSTAARFDYGTGKKTPRPKIPHRVSSVILMIIGGIFLFAGAANAIGSIGPAILTSSLVPFADALVCLGIGLVTGGIGLGFRSKIKKAKKYLSIIGGRGVVKLDDLARTLSISKSKVRKELQSVIDMGVFGECAHIDMESESFLRDASFKPKTEKKEKPPKAPDPSEIDEYTAILMEIRRLDEEILDEPVSQRIVQIEGYTAKIFEYLKNNPAEERNVHSFMTYYLPTTLKLLKSYSEIERVGVAGDNMRSAKESIEKTLDLLVEAFKRLLDKLYASNNIDISTDIDVLEQMMKKDGLSGEGF